MANRPHEMGLDADLARKKQLKYDTGAETEARAFIKEKVGVSIDAGQDNVHAALKDGTVLCKLINALYPGTVAKISASTMPFKQMEQIQQFLTGCEKVGLLNNYLFQTVSLFEAQDIGQVVLCINQLKLLSEGKGQLHSTAGKAIKTDESIIPKQAGFNGGASQSGQNFGNSRHM